MNFWADLEHVITEHESLAEHTWFGLGGQARWFARPRTIEDLSQIARRCRQEDVPLHILGMGANLLVSDEGVSAMVVQLKAPFFRKVDGLDSSIRSQGQVAVIAGGGADMNRLARDAVRQGLGGLETMAGIPGTIGGIVRMNAGGRYGQIADLVRDVSVVDQDGQFRTLSYEEVGFEYRHTRLADLVVCEVTLMLQPEDPVRLRERFLEIWDYKRKSQPLADHSAGCVFKNPSGQTLSAGQLIERAGLKGRTVGGAHVSRHHANFIIAKEGATASDVLILIGVVRREVAEQFSVELEMEIEVWGRRRAPQAEPIV